MFVADTRTDQQKISSLLEQYSHETSLELSHNNHEDIEERLAALKGQEMTRTERTGDNIPVASDSEEEVDKITEKVTFLINNLYMQTCS